MFPCRQHETSKGTIQGSEGLGSGVCCKIRHTGLSSNLVTGAHIITSKLQFLLLLLGFGIKLFGSPQQSMPPREYSRLVLRVIGDPGKQPHLCWSSWSAELLEGNSSPDSFSGVIKAHYKLFSSFSFRDFGSSTPQEQCHQFEGKYFLQTHSLPSSDPPSGLSSPATTFLTSSKPFEPPKPFHCGLWLHLTFV